MRNAASAGALGLAAAALLGGGGSGSSRLLWIGGLALVAAALAYALLGARSSRAGVALLAVGLWLFGRRRAEGVVLAYAAALAVVLTYSRTGVAFAAVAVLLYLVLAREAVTGVVGLACGLAPAGVVLGIASALPGVVG